MAETGSSASASASASKNAVCRYWAKNKDCSFGDQCRLLHGRGDSAPPVVDPTLPHPSRANNNPPKPKPTRADPRLRKGTGAVLGTIVIPEIEPQSETPVRLENFGVVASYNWVNAKKPTIYVPGAPPAWTPPELPVSIPADSGKIVVDRNAYFSPDTPLHPLFHSLLTLQPSFKMTDISLVTDRNNLRKMFEFASGRSVRTFRTEVELVENTLCFIRWELNVLDIAQGSPCSGFGHGFEKTFTTFDKELGGSSANHRIVRYSLGGLQCLVRFEVDAYVEDTSDVEAASSFQKSNHDDDISAAMTSLSLNSKSTRPGDDFAVIPGGRLVPQRSILELKSRGQRGKLQSAIPQLYFSQTEKLYVGYHHRGVFSEEVEMLDMRSPLDEWEANHQRELRTLLNLISKIREFLQKSEKKKAIVICNHREKPPKIWIYSSKAPNKVVDKNVWESLWS